MTMKTKEIKKMFEPLETQVIKLRELFARKPIDHSLLAKKPLLFEKLHSIAQKFEKLSRESDCDYQELKGKITDAVEEFCSLEEIKHIQNIDGCVAEDAIRTLLDKFLMALKTLENVECLPLKQNLQDCWDYIKEMSNAIEIEDLQNIKELGTFILAIYTPLQRYRKTLISKSSSKKIALYSNQLSTVFCMLVELVQEQYQLNAPIYDCKKYLCQRICLCLQMILEIMDSDFLPENESFERENHFVYRMDLALDIISEMSGKTQEEQSFECKELWLGIEDVFSHAMAIAQVCQPYNFKAITGACQSIVTEYENLKIQLALEKSDPALNNLFMSTLTDALYRLERKVNISVLTLVMEVFSDPFHALRKLIMTCGNSLTAKQRSRQDLKNNIEDFDQLTDKIMQIGLFAIACCKDSSRTNTIRNCLAGLESLDTELVTAIITFYLHPDNKEMRASVKLLTAQWQLEMNMLHHTVDLITDSAAYCQVVLDDLQERISVMSDCLDNRQTVTQTHAQGVVQRALSLSSQITRTINDIGNENIERQTIMMLRELKAAIFEADTASKTLLVDNATEPQQLRVIKRCELILNVVKRLQPALVTIMNNSMLKNPICEKTKKGQGDTPYAYGLSQSEKTPAYIRTPYTGIHSKDVSEHKTSTNYFSAIAVKNYKPPVSIQPANTTLRKQTDLSALMPYIQKGRTMRTEQSIMYKTPGKSEETDKMKNQLKMRRLSNVRQHLFSRDSFICYSHADSHDESIDLTSILEKITVLSETLTSNLTNSQEFEGKSHTFVKELTKQNKHGEIPPDNSTVECCAIGGGDAPSTIETLDKTNDIQRLDKKNRNLTKLGTDKI